MDLGRNHDAVTRFAYIVVLAHHNYVQFLPFTDKDSVSMELHSLRTRITKLKNEANVHRKNSWQPYPTGAGDRGSWKGAGLRRRLEDGCRGQDVSGRLPLGGGWM